MAAGVSAVVLSGCTQVVAGSGGAAPPRVPAITSVPSTAPSPSGAPQTGPPAARSGLEIDVLDDECLLNASEFGELVGTAVRPPVQGSVTRGDGSTSASCVATAGDEPLAMVNVYRVESGTPAEYVRAAGSGGRREISGAGEAAVVIDTQTGPTMQLASPAFLVTILVSGRTPGDDAWRAAALAALSRLPG
jgi:hypothetical protein